MPLFGSSASGKGRVARSSATLALEDRLRVEGFAAIAGVDEAGRGPLAGPVSAAAVILDWNRPIAGLADSKALKSREREALFEEIVAKATFACAFSPRQELDRINILQASLLSMRRAVLALAVVPDHVLVDGNMLPQGLPCPATAVIGGDRQSASIAAASIVAKVLRDRMMTRAETGFPGYGFARHAGYGTAIHRRAIAQLGPCPLHRLSFGPFKNGTLQPIDQ